MKKIFITSLSLLCGCLLLVGAGCAKKVQNTNSGSVNGALVNGVVTNTAPQGNNSNITNTTVPSTNASTNTNTSASNTNSAASGSTIDAKQLKTYKGEVDSSQKSVQDSQSVEGSLNSSTTNL